MALSTISSSKVYAKLLQGRLTVSLFAVTGVLIALAEWGLMPREALLVGAPAIITTLLVDTFLFNEFLIRTGAGIWLILYTSLFIQSIIAAAAVRWLSRYWSRRASGTSPA